MRPATPPPPASKQVHAAQDAVVVLQTDHSYLRLPYFLDGKAMAVDGHDVTRHIGSFAS